ncbi:pre-rRNA-processing protein TSR1 homolog isoform X2 [Euwallacea similis]|uniref:pre-rRNA-processing protein TSR1 homolog isoform X2 n=1 Tax=Euwallacea similis TaxID=1736056 RepID=UPI00344EF66E
MSSNNTQVHRPGPYKQTNKEHKHGRHRSKGSISIATKGKVSVKTVSMKSKRELNRDQRRHQSAQIRQKKRDETLAKKRLLGGLDFAPFLVSVVPLNKDFDPTSAISILTQCDDEAVVRRTSAGVTHICVPRFRKRFSLIVPASDNELDVLDSLKVSDAVVFLLSSINAAEYIEEIVDKWGNKLLMSCLAQGLPTPVVILTDLDSIAPKKRNDFKQNVQKIVNQWLPDEKLMVLDKNADAINILRKIGDQKRKSVLYRDRRPYLYGEEVEYVPDTRGPMGTLKVTGYLRGSVLSVNQLVHIPGLGDLQMLQIDILSDPNKVDKPRKKDFTLMDDKNYTIKVLEQCDPSKQESLDSENVLDPMDTEQTWPTNEDYEMAEKDQQLRKAKKVPKGWSDYQAAWIPDDDAEFQEDAFSDGDQDSDDELMDARSVESSCYSNGEDRDQDLESVTEESELAVNEDKYDQEINLNAEKDELNKIKEAKSDFMFPDEIDTPMDTTARERFLKYRGLESFRTSPWDPKENLPSNYARIFQFQNFQRSRKRVLKEEASKTGAMPGWYITIYVKNISQLMWSTVEKTKSPIVIIGLYPHEHKMSIMNVILKRTQNHGFPIKSKERLIFQCGFRRFVVNPIFSEHTNGQKHKAL